MKNEAKQLNTDINLIIEYLKDHSLNDASNHFNESSYIIRRELKKLGLQYTRNQNEGRKLGWKNIIISKVNKEELEEYYKSHTINEVMSYFHISRNSVNKLLNYYKIEKKDIGFAISQGQNRMTEEAKKARVQKLKQTNLERYGVEICSKLPECQEKRAQTTFERYGVYYPLQSSQLLEKAKNTCLENYGVQYPCMRKEAKIKGSNSHINQSFNQLLNDNNIEHDIEFPIDRKNYDFKIGNTLIEINPSITHNSNWTPFRDHEGLPINYHQEKSKLATENGYNCIHVWDWDDWNKIIKLIQPKERIFARKCEIKEPTIEEAKQFINQNHLQNYTKDQIRIGLYYNNELISIMTFGKPRYNKKYEYELLRYCYTKQVVGGAEKLFHYFIEKYNPSSIISYCDLSKFTGNVYEKLGFIKGKNSNPSIHWYNLDTKKHITNNLLNQRGFDQLLGKEYGCYGKGTSNTDLMLQHGFVQIYDCGQQAYYWNK